MFHRMLVIVESSREGLEAARAAVRLAAGFDAQLIAFSVLDTSIARHIRDTAKASEMLVDLEEDAWKYLYHVEEMAVNHRVRVALQLAEGIPEKEIVTAINKFKPDLVVLPRKGQRGMLQRGVAKVVEHLLDRAPCAIMIA